jgi:dsRNA-specific ribonuclease
MASASISIPAQWDPPRIDIRLDNLPPLPPLPADRLDLPFYHKSYIQEHDRRGNEPGYAELLCQKPSESLGDSILAAFVSSAIAQLRFPIQPGLSTVCLFAYSTRCLTIGVT